MNNISFKPRNFLFYLIGGAAIAFGVIFMVRSQIGTSTWDTLHVAISEATPITLGWATIVVAIAFTIAVIILNKNWVYVFMVIPVFGVGWFIDFVDQIIMVNYEPTTLFTQILSYIVGLLILPLGGSLLIISTFPAGVFDEFNLAVMRVLKSKSLVKIRVIMELTAVAVALLISLSSGNDIGTLNVGTVIFALTVGLILKQYLKLFERIGLYNEDK
jgi:uncharacterized membrane protein YczE